MAGIIKRSTANFALAIPRYDTPGWGAAFERNMDIIDAVLSTAGVVSNIIGEWGNSTVYGQDDRVVDSTDNTVWQAAVAHTSAASGTFAADRAANPTYWDVVTTNIVVREQFVTGTDYFIGDYVYDTTQQLAGIVQTAFTGGANLRTHIASLGVIYDLQADFGAMIHAATEDTSPDDADEFGVWDSATGLLGRITWANIKAGIWSALGSLINTGTGKTTPVDADEIPLADSAASFATKKLSWANVKATLVATINTWTAKQTFQNAEFTTAALNLSVGQLKFPAAQNASADANTLDDYEEGTFTPTIAGFTTPGTGTYTTQQGTYTKVGNAVHFTTTLIWTAHTGTGATVVAGLPFTPIGRINPVSLAVGDFTFTNQIGARLNGTSTTVLLTSQASNTALSTQAVDGSGEIEVAGTYFT